jgi:hypothetical protein
LLIVWPPLVASLFCGTTEERETKQRKYGDSTTDMKMLVF